MVLSPHPDVFLNRHLGPREHEIQKMLEAVGAASLDALSDEIIPAAIRTATPLPELKGLSEAEMLRSLQSIADSNRVLRSFIGQGYYASVLPPVIQRNVLENPGWYTAYTPYQAEISQGRMEALLNFQTLVTELTGMEIANASLLDEATAVAEAVGMCHGLNQKPERTTVTLIGGCHPQTAHVVRTRAEVLGIPVVDVATMEDFLADSQAMERSFVVVASYPDTLGTVNDLAPLGAALNAAGIYFVVSADLLSLALLRPPGQWGADVVVGSTQRLGLPMGWGGPHAAYFATRDAFKRNMPGRLIGVSKDAAGKPALRLSLQTREQHIRRDKATSNICTAQVLPAVIASMYVVYHGAAGLRAIAARIASAAASLSAALERAGLPVRSGLRFDTIVLDGDDKQCDDWMAAGLAAGMNFRRLPNGVALSLDERTDEAEVTALVRLFTGQGEWTAVSGVDLLPCRADSILRQEVFNSHRSESSMMRYLKRLENKDISLTHSMIPLGSCTMKLNAAAEMMAITWGAFADMHPFAPMDQAQGYRRVCDDLEHWLGALTGFAAVSLQPNAGSQGEYAGLLAIRKFHESRGQSHRSVCLIPQSAHGTNFASAVMIGYRVVVVQCDADGNIDAADLSAKAEANRDELAAAMITYPSTHGVFEAGICELCRVIHEHGGQVYMDGANMNAQVGLTNPAAIGADVCHLNLHKTFCIPHGGGGPGMGPIGVAAHLAPFLPAHPLDSYDPQRAGAVSATPFGSGCILLISWAYIAMMGGSGLRQASQVAMLNANYIAARLRGAFEVLYRGAHGRVAHECILDLRDLKKRCGIEVEDVAKRLIDYGFHAPTMSWPVPGTLMVEPTESEDLHELDRFCDAMLSIHREIGKVSSGEWPQDDNPLKQAPHTAEEVASSWEHVYSREEAVFPLASLHHGKYWPPVKRVDNVYGDRNLFCTCAPPPVAE